MIIVSMVLMTIGTAWFVLFELFRLGRRFEMKSIGWMLFVRFGGLLPLIMAAALAFMRARQISAAH